MTDYPQRKKVRLAGFDYRMAGAYFVTLVTLHREILFDTDPARTAVEESWFWLANQYPYVTLDYAVVMPNHFHGILWIEDSQTVRSQAAPTADGPPVRVKPLGQLIGAFKTVSTRRINRLRGGPDGVPVWQRSYYEHIVRDEAALNRIRQYIIENPSKWGEDPENPAGMSAIARGKLLGPN